MTRKEDSQKIYLSLLNHKKILQTFITNLLYSFRFKRKGINDYIEPQLSLIYQNILKNLNLSEDKFWERYRFYLKGGKALNKLVKNLCKEDKYKLLLSTEELLRKVDKCFIDKKIFAGSNTDYDFTFLTKNPKDINQDLFDIILNSLKEVENNLNRDQEFNQFVIEFTKFLNKKKNLDNLIKGFENTKSEILKDIKNQDNQTKEYFKIKINQIDNFIEDILLSKKLNQNFFKNGQVITTYSTIPIDIKVSKDITQSFILFRSKLFFDTNIPFKKMNRDIKDYLFGIEDNLGLPFDNIFGELIDISIQTGDQETINDMLKASEKQYIIESEKNYPVVGLKYQLKDVIQIFNVENPSKLKKRCERFLEYIKMLCYSEEIPNEFMILISDALQEEIQEENINQPCSKLVNTIKILSENKVENNYFIVKKEKIKKIFPSYCKAKYNIDFKNKEEVIEKIIDNSKMLLDIDISKKILKNIRMVSLLKLLNDEENFKKNLEKIKKFDEISRIIPLEIDL